MVLQGGSSGGVDMAGTMNITGRQPTVRSISQCLHALLEKQEIARTDVLAKSSPSPRNFLAKAISEDIARTKSPRKTLRR